MRTTPDNDHPLRTCLTQEMHLRRLPRLSAPAQALQWLVLHQDGVARDAPFQHVQDLARYLDGSVLDRVKHVSLASGELQFVWEEHTEFCTYTFVRQGDFPEPFGKFALDQLPPKWIETLPGLTFRATRVALIADHSPDPSHDPIESLFNADDVVCCDLYDGAARVWTDFRRADDGFGRLLISDKGLVGGDAPRLVQQLLELGNYRKMALLGLPVARQVAHGLQDAESQLAELSSRIAGQQDEDEALLRDITALSARLARMAADTRYRLSATKAYANIVADRLENLGVVRLPGSASLREFNERRLLPAVRTCASASQRLEGLSEQASWTNGLIRTRIDTATNRQSRDLLGSMNRRTQLQLRLQQTVEGLSVVAISYYSAGLIHYIAEAVGEDRMGVSTATLTGATVPIIVGVTALVMHRLRQTMTRNRSR